MDKKEIGYMFKSGEEYVKGFSSVDNKLYDVRTISGEWTCTQKESEALIIKEGINALAILNVLNCSALEEYLIIPIFEKEVKIEVMIKVTIPNTCGECKFYSEPSYQCHNERGTQAHCAMGYMHGDKRDKSFRNRKYKFCKLEHEGKVWDRVKKAFVEDEGNGDEAPPANFDKIL